MADHMTLAGLDALESPLVEDPLFFVEAPGEPGPDPKLWPEEERQAAFIAHIKKTHSPVNACAIRNEGKRGLKEQRQMKRTGLKSGAFDTLIFWDVKHASPDCPATVAMCEFKGFDARGRPGTLSANQIEYGNDLTRRGHKVACFYTAKAALEWLAGLGAPIRGRIAA